MTDLRLRTAGGALSLVAALVACWPGDARAYRPFDGTDAAVVDRGEAEVALGLGWAAEGAGRALFAPTAVGSWGFAHDWEAVIEARQLVTLGLLDVGAQRTRVEDAAVALEHVLRGGELQVVGAAERGGPTELSARAGAIWRASGALSIDAALRVARIGGVRAVEVRAGLTWAFAAGFPRAAR